mgnify:CR=1 FL=1
MGSSDLVCPILAFYPELGPDQRMAAFLCQIVSGQKAKRNQIMSFFPSNKMNPMISKIAISFNLDCIFL